MAYPEPSYHDHNAPWNMDEDEETGEWICSCTSCKKAARDEAIAECKIADWEDRRERF